MKLTERAILRGLERQKKPRTPLKRSTVPLRAIGRAKTRDIIAEPQKTPRTRRAIRRKVKKRTRLPSRAKLVKELDRLTSLIVRLKGNGCVICGSQERLQCGHLFGRRSHGARFDIEEGGNCSVQCAPCNKNHNNRPYIYLKWHQDRFGTDVTDALYRRWSAGHKYSRLELINMVAEYKAKWEGMQDG